VLVDFVNHVVLSVLLAQAKQFVTHASQLQLIIQAAEHVVVIQKLIWLLTIKLV
jgi:hypothetical protein